MIPREALEAFERFMGGDVRLVSVADGLRVVLGNGLSFDAFMSSCAPHESAKRRDKKGRRDGDGPLPEVRS